MTTLKNCFSLSLTMELNDTTTLLIMTLHITTLLIMAIPKILNTGDITYSSLYL
jgi:hypothetical protein